MADATSPNIDNPRHHLTLTDGSVTLGFRLGRIDRKFEFLEDERAIQRFPHERTALKILQGGGTYDDYQWPYMNIAQENWNGGRGKKVFDDDKSRYWDGFRVDTGKEGEVLLGSVQTHAINYREQDFNSNRSLTFQSLLTSQQYISAPFTSSSAYSSEKIEIVVKKVGTPNAALTIDIFTDSGGDPDAQQGAGGTATIAVASVTDTLAVRLEPSWSTTTKSISDATAYHVVIWASGSDTVSNHWEVGCIETAGVKSSNGTIWEAFTHQPCFRSTDAEASYPEGRGIYFDYKSALYCITQPDDATNSFLYINGDRGAADANTGALTTLVDATKSWTADEWIGARVEITKGPGSEEAQPWRVITDNDTTSLTVSPAFIIEHTTDTEYVIVNTDKMTQLLDLGDYVTDVTVGGEFVYFARGDSGSTTVLRYEAYNNAGTWATRSDAEVEQAVHLEAIYHPEDGLYIYGARNSHAYYGAAIWRGKVPDAWGDLYNSIGTLSANTTPWDDLEVANVTQSASDQYTKIEIAAGFTTGIAAREVEFTAVDITSGNYLGWVVYASAAVTASYLELHISDTADLGGTSTDLALPALVAGWNWVIMAISPLKVPAPDHTAIISVGLNVATDPGAVDLSFGPLHILADTLEYTQLPDDSPVNNIVQYSGNVDDPRANPWILTDNGIYEMQTQNDNIIVPIPLGEIKAMVNERNGVVAGSNDVYIYFNLNEWLQRYYARTMEHIGPELDDGLPDDRQGIISAIVSLPGRVLVAYDGGLTDYSHIVMYKANGYTEIYRAPRVGERIRAAHFQSIPGMKSGRLWLSMGSSLLWIYISLNPRTDATNSEYHYTHEGALTTGWMYANMRNVVKFFKSVAMFLDAGTSSPTAGAGQYIALDYQVDDDTSWTAVTTGIFGYPYTENNLDSATPPTVTGKRIRFRLRFQSDDSTESPILTAMILDAYGVAAVKYAYQFQALLSENIDQAVDLHEDPDSVLGQYTDVGSAMTKLEAWASAGTPLTMNAVFSFMDAKTVILDPNGVAPINWEREEQVEEHLLQVTCNEI